MAINWSRNHPVDVMRDLATLATHRAQTHMLEDPDLEFRWRHLAALVNSCADMWHKTALEADDKAYAKIYKRVI